MRRVVGAYHVATFPGWSGIVEEQCKRLDESGLLDRTSKILVGVVGDPGENTSLISDLLGQGALVRQLGPLSSFEFPTLQWLYEEVSDKNVACWYAHTKGVSTLSRDKVKWRLKMESVIFDQYEKCIEALETHDICGIDWTSDPLGRSFYSGNFWWANSSYLRTLKPPSSALLDQSDRLVGPPSLAVGYTKLGRAEAELWIGRNPSVRPFKF
jgi:hypothetical protein